MRVLHVVLALATVASSSACSDKDKAVLTGKGTSVNSFQFKPKTAAEMSAPASSASMPRGAIDDFHFKPKTEAEMSKPPARSASARPSALDTFVFIPKTGAEMSAPSKAH